MLSLQCLLICIKQLGQRQQHKRDTSKALNIIFRKDLNTFTILDELLEGVMTYYLCPADFYDPSFENLKHKSS